jgi:hypothetical protein
LSLAGTSGNHIVRNMPIIDIDVRYNFGEAAQVPGVDRQLVPQRQPASLEVVSMKVSGD